MVTNPTKAGEKKPPASASPDKSTSLKFKKITPKSSLSPKKGGSPTKVYIAGSSFNAVFLRTVHPLDPTKDGFTYTAKEALRADNEAADRLKCVNVSKAHQNGFKQLMNFC